MSGYTWDILPHFLLRSTGFPYQWLEKLALRETVNILDELLDIEEEERAAGAALQETASGEASHLERGLLRQVQTAVRRKSPLKQAGTSAPGLSRQLQLLIERWNTLLARHQQCEQQARATFAREIADRRLALYTCVLDPRFQEAVWLSSPQMYEHGLLPYLRQWGADRRTSDLRRIERQIISYLQRFCAKNDTASFFGPINYGDFASSSAAIGPGAGSVEQRQTFLAYWAVMAIAEKITRDEAVHPYLCPRPHPLYQTGGVDGHEQDRPAPTFTQRQRALLSSIDGKRTSMRIAEELGVPIKELLQDIHQLAGLRIVIMRLEVPVTAPDALAWLAAWIHDLPPACATRDHWCEIVDHCQALQRQFSTASLAERREILQRLEGWFESVIRHPARREGGQLYADRLLLYEECYGGIGVCSLGPDCLAELQAQIAPVLDLYAAHACSLHQELRKQGTKALLALSENSRGSMPFLTFLQAQGRQAEPPLRDCSAWQQSLLEQVRASADARVVALDMASLPVVDRAALSASPLLASPDVMLLTRDEAALRAGDFTVVMAECHDTLLVWGWGLYFHPRKKEVEAAGKRLLRRLAHTGECANVLPSKRAKIIPFEYPGPTIEMLAASQKAPDERIPMAAIRTEVKGEDPFLAAPGHPLLRLYNGELSSFVHNIFALPRIHPLRIELPGHTPRIMLGKVVFQREQWRFTRKQFLPGTYAGTSFELMRDVHRAARQAGLPRYLFLRVPGERKPVFIDRYNYFLLELLHYLLPADGELTLQEMLPTPDQLWLRNEQGAFCAELRLGVGYAAKGEDDGCV